MSKSKRYRTHNSDAISILNCALDSPFYIGGSGKYFSEIDSFKIIIHGLRIQACFVFFLVALFELSTLANNGKCPTYLDSQAEMSVRVRTVSWSKHFDIRMMVPMSYFQEGVQKGEIQS